MPGAINSPRTNNPGLARRQLVQAVEDFYARYSFRPRIVWRIVRRALADRHERARLFAEAR